MALIGRIRKHSALLLIIIGVALAAFVLGDFIKKGPKNSNKLAVIDGENISWLEFDNRFKQNEENYKQQSGKENFSPEEVFQLREMAWNQLIRELLLDKEFKKLGIDVSEEEMTDMISGKNPHPNIQQIFRDPETGVFSPAAVQNFIQNKDQAKPEEQKYFDNLIKNIKDERLNNKYTMLIAKSYYLPKPLAKKMYEDYSSNATLRVIQANYKLIDDKTITLADDDYKKWYEDNKHKFDQPEEIRDIDYVIFDINPTPEDLKAIEEEVAKIYKEFQESNDAGAFVGTLQDAKYDSSYFKKGVLPMEIDSVVFNNQIGAFMAPVIINNEYNFAKLIDIKMRPDSVKASHILVQYEGARNSKVKRTKDEAKKLADSILVQVRKTPNMFANFVLNNSEYPTAKKDTGNLNWIIDGDYNYQLFYDSLYYLKNNDMRIVETALGYHVMIVTDKTVANKKVRVAIGKKEIAPSEKTIQDVFAVANKFAAENENTIKFNESVVKQGLNKRTADKLKAMEYSVLGVKDSREIVRWAYDEKTKKNSVSQVFDVDNKYVIATLKEIKPAGIATLEQVKPYIETVVKREKKAQQLIDKMNVEIGKTKDPIVLAEQFKSKVDTVANFNFGAYNLFNYGPELSVIGNISNMKPGQVSKPLKGEMGVYVVYYDQFTPATPTNDYKFISMQLGSMFSQRVNSEVFKAIEKNAKIKDHRVMYY